MEGIHQPSALGPLRRILREQAPVLGFSLRSVELVPGPFGGSDVRVDLDAHEDAPEPPMAPLLELVRAGLAAADLRPLSGPEHVAW